jgi:heme exporter protein CcmD
VTGVLEGGWGFVWAAYAVTAATLLGYALSVHLRYRAERDRQRREREEAKR